MSRCLTVLLLLWLGQFAAHAQSQNDAFDQGKTTGRSGNSAARAQIQGGTAASNVPGYNTSPPQASYFSSPGIAAPAADLANGTRNCVSPANGAGPGGQVQADTCNAIEFTQMNPGRRPVFSIGNRDPLLTGAKAITADPQSIAGNIAGTYSGCTVQTTTSPDRFETALCHQSRVSETLSCDKVLTVTATMVPGCQAGEFLTSVYADPCPGCIDFLSFDFSCTVDGYQMHVYSVFRDSGGPNIDLGTQQVPGRLNLQIPKTPGPSGFNGYLCYQTYFSQSCSGANCAIGAWFSNPCQGTSFYGVSTFEMPTTLGFVDTWINQCSALEARAR